MYMDKKMIRKQIYLSGEQDRELRQLSFLKGASQADVIREALDHYLAESRTPTSEAAPKAGKKRGGKPGKAPAPAPLSGIVGLAGDLEAPEDLSSRHDFYLYGGDRD